MLKGWETLPYGLMSDLTGKKELKKSKIQGR